MRKYKSHANNFSKFFIDYCWYNRAFILAFTNIESNSNSNSKTPNLNRITIQILETEKLQNIETKKMK